jgi:hypothetical protein
MAAVWLFVAAANQPLDAAALLVSVSELRSQSSEAQQLLARIGRHEVADIFARGHFTQLLKNVSSVRSNVMSASARVAVYDEKQLAARYAAELELALAPLANSDVAMNAPATAAVRMGALRSRIVELEYVLRARTR